MKSGNKILICNGGSAADAQHLAAEFLIRLRPKINRKVYPVISLALILQQLQLVEMIIVLMIYFKKFSSFIKGDILIVISTSGKSKNIIKILKYTSSKKFFH